jgi:hypothetical protein
MEWWINQYYSGFQTEVHLGKNSHNLFLFATRSEVGNFHHLSAIIKITKVTDVLEFSNSKMGGMGNIVSIFLLLN